MGDEYPKFKVAAVQASPILLDREATVDKACDLIRDAGAKGARIIGFPENYIPTHPVWYSFIRADEATKYNRELFKNSVEIPSPATDKLCEAAKEADAYVVMGLTEKDHGTLGTLYNTQLFLDRKGTIMGKHRKIMPTITERLVHTGGDGSTLNVFKTDHGELGGLICGEHSNSLARFTLLAKGEKIHVGSWPPFTPSKQIWNSVEVTIRYHAIEGRLFAICSSMYFSDEMLETLCDTEEKKALVRNRGGNSSIIGPNGNFIAGPLEEGEGIVVGEVDYEKTIDAKVMQDVTGHYNRFDIFKLHVHEEPNKILD